MPLRVIVLGAM